MNQTFAFYPGVVIHRGLLRRGGGGRGCGAGALVAARVGGPQPLINTYKQVNRNDYHYKQGHQG